MRLFIAADLPEDARRAVEAEQRRMASALGRSAGSLKWGRADHAPLTLVFLGNVDDGRVPAVMGAVDHRIEAAAFEITLEGFGVFPAHGAPRVLWVGIGGGASELAGLQRELAGRISALGIGLED